MQTIDKFNSNLGTAIALVGGAGAGKTTLALRLFPKTYCFIADLNFKSALDYFERNKTPCPVLGFDQAYSTVAGLAVSTNQRYKHMLDCLQSAIANKDIDCIVLDSGTFIEDIIKARICLATTDAAIKLSGFEQWGQLVLLWKSLIMELRQSGKKVIFTFHENKEKDESDQIFKYQIAVDGSIRGKIPAYFSDVWRCEVRENQGKHAWWVRTLGNVRQEHLKNTYGLPGELLQDDLVKQLALTNRPNTPISQAGVELASLPTL